MQILKLLCLEKMYYVFLQSNKSIYYYHLVELRHKTRFFRKSQYSFSKKENKKKFLNNIYFLVSIINHK